MLLTAVIAVLALGMLLEYGGKTSATEYPQNAVNINQISRTDSTEILGAPLDKGIAGSGEYASVNELLTSRSWRRRSFEPDLVRRLVVRTPFQVARLYFFACLLFLASSAGIHLFLRRFAPDSDQFLLPIVTLLAGIGVILLFDVQDPYRDSLAYLGQAVGVALWGTVGLIIPFTPWYRAINLRRSGYFCVGVSLALLVLMRLFGRGPGGVPLRLAGVEPVEFIKVLMVFYMCAYLVDRMGVINSSQGRLRRSDIVPMAVMCLITAGLFLVVKDLGPVILIFGSAALLLYLTSGRLVYPLGAAAVLAFACVAGSVVHIGFLHTRVVMWLHPWLNDDPHGAQLAQGFWGFATGGFTGSGLGLGDPETIPRGGSDLIFATLGEELGLVGALCLLALYSVLICRGLRIAYRASTSMDRAVASGVTLLLGLQTCAITGGVSGLLPLTGVTLPFVAHGTSSLMSDYFCIGALLAISARRLRPELTDKAPDSWRLCADRVFVGFAAFLLLAVGIVRLGPLQLIDDRALAAEAIVNPDADGISRPHRNPRLMDIAKAIPRGRILDRNGLVLAEDSQDTSRIYAGGAATALWLSRVEGEASQDNPLGQDQALRGYADDQALVDAYRMRYLPFRGRLSGSDVSLTMDYGLQQAAYAALLNNRGSAGSFTGEHPNGSAMVFVDRRTGEVLAEVSLPTPDKIGSPNTVLDRAIDGRYTPGSTFKVVTAAAGLADGLAGYTVICHHEVDNLIWRSDGQTYSRRQVTDEAGFPPHGFTGMSKAMSDSCNVYFSQLGLKIGANDLARTARGEFGLHLMPDATTMGPDLPDSAYGQGKDLATPVEMAFVAQTIANDGARVAPVFTLGQRTTQEPGIPTPDARTIQAMLLSVTQQGTAQGVFDRVPVPVAGKTGSAQTSGPRTDSWFIGYAPAANPEIAFACVVEQGGAGREAAAPACRDALLAASREGLLDGRR